MTPDALIDHCLALAARYRDAAAARGHAHVTDRAAEAEAGALEDRAWRDFEEASERLARSGSAAAAARLQNHALTQATTAAIEAQRAALRSLADAA